MDRNVKRDSDRKALSERNVTVTFLNTKTGEETQITGSSDIHCYEKFLISIGYRPIRSEKPKAQLTQVSTLKDLANNPIKKKQQSEFFKEIRRKFTCINCRNERPTQQIAKNTEAMFGVGLVCKYCVADLKKSMGKK